MDDVIGSNPAATSSTHGTSGEPNEIEAAAEKMWSILTIVTSGLMVRAKDLAVVCSPDDPSFRDLAEAVSVIIDAP